MALNRLHVECVSLEICGRSSTLAFHSLSLIKNLVIHWFSLCLRFMATRDPKEVANSVSTVALLWNAPKGLCAKGLNSSFKMLQGGGASKNRVWWEPSKRAERGLPLLLLGSLPLS